MRFGAAASAYAENAARRALRKNGASRRVSSVEPAAMSRSGRRVVQAAAISRRNCCLKIGSNPVGDAPVARQMHQNAGRLQQRPSLFLGFRVPPNAWCNHQRVTRAKIALTDPRVHAVVAFNHHELLVDLNHNDRGGPSTKVRALVIPHKARELVTVKDSPSYLTRGRIECSGTAPSDSTFETLRSNPVYFRPNFVGPIVRSIWKGGLPKNRCSLVIR
jgi:hypothetical protein